MDPTVFGFSLALGAIPFYESVVFMCHIVAPPVGDHLWPVYFFFLVPAFFVIIIVTLVMGYIYLSVRRKATANKKWQFSFRRNKQEGASGGTPESVSNTNHMMNSNVMMNGVSWEGRRKRQAFKKPSMESEVLCQSLLYLSAFYLTWPITAYAYDNSNSSTLGFPFWMTVFTLAPMQGFCNALVSMVTML